MLQKQQVKAVKPKKSFGNLRLNSSIFAGVKQLKLGQKLKLTVEVEVESLRQPDRWEVSEGSAKPNDVLSNVNITNIIFPKEKKEEK